MIADVVLLVFRSIFSATNLFIMRSVIIVVVYGISLLIIFSIVVRQQKKIVKGYAKFYIWPSSGCGTDNSTIRGRKIAAAAVSNHHQ